MRCLVRLAAPEPHEMCGPLSSSSGRGGTPISAHGCDRGRAHAGEGSFGLMKRISARPGLEAAIATARTTGRSHPPRAMRDLSAGTRYAIPAFPGRSRTPRILTWRIGPVTGRRILHVVETGPSLSRSGDRHGRRGQKQQAQPSLPRQVPCSAQTRRFTTSGTVVAVSRLFRGPSAILVARPHLAADAQPGPRSERRGLTAANEGPRCARNLCEPLRGSCTRSAEANVRTCARVRFTGGEDEGGDETAALGAAGRERKRLALNRRDASFRIIDLNFLSD